MKIFLAAIAFAATIGGLFLFENYKTLPKEEDYAQIVQSLKNQNSTPKITTTKPPARPTKTPATPTASQNHVSTPTPSTIIHTTTTAPTWTPTSSLNATPSPAAQITTPTATPIPSLNTTPAQLTSTPAPSSTPIPTEQNNQITIVSLTSPVKQNSEAKLAISATPGTLCFIKVILPSGTQSSAKDISSELPLSEPRAIDVSGSISWSWKINWNTLPGTANITITCAKDGRDFSKSLQMSVIER